MNILQFSFQNLSSLIRHFYLKFKGDYSFELEELKFYNGSAFTNCLLAVSEAVYDVVDFKRLLVRDFLDVFGDFKALIVSL